MPLIAFVFAHALVALAPAPEAEPGPVPGGEGAIVDDTAPQTPVLESIASAPLPSPSQAWRVEGLVAMSATTPSSNVETTVAPWLGVRVGTLAPARDAASVGFDGALYLGQVKDGTPEVSTTRSIAFVEGRGLFAPMRAASTFSALVPYGFLGASAGGGFVEVRAFEEARIRPLFTWATRVGLGAELQVHALTTRLELGAGLRDLRAELTSALSLGIAF